MNIQELFRTIDTETFVEAYLRESSIVRDFLLEDKLSLKKTGTKFNRWYNRTVRTLTIAKKSLRLAKLRQRLARSFDEMKAISNVKTDETPCIAFAISYEEDGLQGWDAFCSEQDDILNVETIERVEKYGFEFEPIESILGYTVSETCRFMYDDISVAVALFDEMTFFGIDIEKRNNKIKVEKEKIDEASKECKEANYENCKPIGDLFASLGWEDERTEAEKEFDKQRMILAGKGSMQLYNLYFAQEKYYLTRAIDVPTE